jgi:hypothetical protein
VASGPPGDADWSWNGGDWDGPVFARFARPADAAALFAPAAPTRMAAAPSDSDATPGLLRRTPAASEALYLSRDDDTAAAAAAAVATAASAADPFRETWTWW